MKALLKFMILAAVVILAIPMVMFAQDTTAITGVSSPDIISYILTAIEVKWPVIASIGTVLFFISEVLGSIPSVKQNAVYQVVFMWLGKLFGKKK